MNGTILLATLLVEITLGLLAYRPAPVWVERRWQR